MSGSSGTGGHDGPHSSSEDLSARIQDARKKLEKPALREKQPLAWHFLSEVIAGILVGGGAGWLADAFFGTKPWLFVALLLMGVVGAFWNMMRLASREEIGHTGPE